MENNCNINPKPFNFKEYIKSRNFRKTVLFMIIGAAVGFGYYYSYHCTGASCVFTESFYANVLTGAFGGFFLANRPCGC